MTTLLQDLRYGLRTLAKAPAFSLAAVFILALGIGANTAIFSVVNAVILRPLPLADSSRIMRVWHTHPRSSLPAAPPSRCRQRTTWIGAGRITCSIAWRSIRAVVWPSREAVRRRR